jgi:hypothetical protein
VLFVRRARRVARALCAEGATTKTAPRAHCSVSRKHKSGSGLGAREPICFAYAGTEVSRTVWSFRFSSNPGASLASAKTPATRRKAAVIQASSGADAECRVAWKAIAAARLLFSTDAGARWEPIARRRTTGHRPSRKSGIDHRALVHAAFRWSPAATPSDRWRAPRARVLRPVRVLVVGAWSCPVVE